VGVVQTEKRHGDRSFLERIALLQFLSGFCLTAK
jgi:hypothetical protein